MSEKYVIYAVDDEESIRELYRYALESAGFEVSTFDGGDALFARLSERLPDLILLDIMLDGSDGYELLDDIRKNPETRETPVIMVSAKGAEIDKVKGLDLGADDYISKPFSIREVLVRVRAVLRRTSDTGYAPHNNIISYQGLELNLDKKTVAIDGEDIPFTKTEFEILHLLLDERGRVFSRQELIDRVWPKDVLVLDRTVDVNITRLRKKIGRFSKCIVTRLGFGYYFDA